ncbi:MAG: right-handed parallel beta-helix repeat-containing protein [Paraglaciecola sp.]|uniref:right-handed parallel beta-helix repeat-containing protein n=3 Tax=Paraglaciecola sp. TaxID=1920173 RepID=UPI003297B31A
MITTVPTFHNISVYWTDAQNASESNYCSVQYRAVGSDTWKSGIDLVYDGRGGDYGDAEYRGSIVKLFSNTTYEVKLTLESGETETTIAKTVNENFTEKSVVELPENTNGTLVITNGGSEEEGYVVYTVGPTGAALITGGTYNIRVDVPYVIIRGLTLADAVRHAIYLSVGTHHVIVEENDISEWGRSDDEDDPDAFAFNFDSGVFSKDPDGYMYVIQRNKIHHPRHDSNNWTEPGDQGNNHPDGAQAISLENTAGNHVIRYNEIYSDEDHYFNDGIGATENYSYQGSPNKDSDIYGNYISHCWDDGIESEGANRNVRIWGNYITNTYTAIATAGTSIGPLYIWENVYNISQESNNEPWSDESGTGGFIKTAKKAPYTGGKLLIFSNTILQPTVDNRVFPVGASTGLGWGGDMDNVMSRNNILQVCDPDRPSINGQTGDNGDYDYDLYNGRIDSGTVQEYHGIYDQPTYAEITDSYTVFTTGKGVFQLAESSPGIASGIAVNNINDGYSSPDIGAFQSGSAPMEFGVNAYSQNWVLQLVPDSTLTLENVPAVSNDALEKAHKIPSATLISEAVAKTSISRQPKTTGILFEGDVLTGSNASNIMSRIYGIQAALDGRLIAFEGYNQGTTAASSSTLLNRIETTAGYMQPIISVQIGSDDVVYKVDIDTIKANILKLISLYKAYGADIVMLHTIPDRSGTYAWDNEQLALKETINNWMATIDLPNVIVDTTSAELMDTSTMLADGRGLNLYGSLVIGAEQAKYIKLAVESSDGFVGYLSDNLLPNPSMSGEDGTITGADTSGVVADDFAFELNADGLTATLSKSENIHGDYTTAQTISLSGETTATSSIIRLRQTIALSSSAIDDVYVLMARYSATSVTGLANITMNLLNNVFESTNESVDDDAISSTAAISGTIVTSQFQQMPAGLTSATYEIRIRVPAGPVDIVLHIDKPILRKVV